MLRALRARLWFPPAHPRLDIAAPCCLLPPLRCLLPCADCEALACKKHVCLPSMVFSVPTRAQHAVGARLLLFNEGMNEWALTRWAQKASKPLHGEYRQQGCRASGTPSAPTPLAGLRARAATLRTAQLRGGTRQNLVHSEVYRGLISHVQRQHLAVPV